MLFYAETRLSCEYIKWALSVLNIGFTPLMRDFDLLS